MRITYPLLTAARVDAGLRRLFISELITQDVNEGREVILPEGAAIKMVSKDTYKAYKEALSGLNEENVQEVTAQLIRLGLGGDSHLRGAGTLQWPGPPSGGGAAAGSFHPGASGEQQGSQFAPGGGVSGPSATS